MNTKIAMISTLKFKFLSIVETILDGDDDGDIIKLISQYISDNTIKSNIQIIYNKFKFLYKTGSNYKNDTFDHINKQPP